MSFGFSPREHALPTASGRSPAARATSIARGVDGVRKVVRVFEILTEDQLVRLGNQRPAPVTHDAAPASPVQPSIPAQ